MMKREEENGTTNSSEETEWRKCLSNKLLITEEERGGGKWDNLVLTNISAGLLWPCYLDSIAVSIFVIFLVDFDKYRIGDEQAFVGPAINQSASLGSSLLA